MMVRDDRQLIGCTTTRQGFTLFELIVVMAIILVIVGLATPFFLDHLHGDAKVTAAADMVRARWADCRTQAIEENRPYQFSVIPNTGKFKVEPHDPNAPDGVADPNNDPKTSNGETSRLVIEDVLPTGVRFGTKDVPASDGDEPETGTYVIVAVFNADGSAQQDVEVTFGGPGVAPVTLRLRAMTGATSTTRNTGDQK